MYFSNSHRILNMTDNKIDFINAVLIKSYKVYYQESK